MTWLGLSAAGLVVALLGLRSSRTEHVGPRDTAEGGPHASPPAALPAPSPREVREALERVFGDVLAAEGGSGTFCVADFNGDGSEDLAAASRPRAQRLAEVNDPFANWTIQDAEHPPSPAAPAEPRRPTVEAHELLLVVIHGDGPLGWRQPEARQGYLVRSGVELPCRPRRPDELKLMSSAAGAMLPRVAGDVLLEGGPGSVRFLYWTGARYVWHSPPTNPSPGSNPPGG